MTKRIFRSMSLLAIIVLLAGTFVVMATLYGYATDIQQEEMSAQLRLASRGVEQSGASYLNDLDMGETRLTWIGENGTVLYDNMADAASMDNHRDREEFREALLDGYGESHRSSTTLAEKNIYLAQRLSDGTVLRIAATQDTIAQLSLGILLPVIMILIIALIISLLVAHRTSRKIVEPLNHLDLEHPLNNRVYEEITPLLSRIDGQRKQIDLQISEILEGEQMRREFSANVSHELKTPLHSIMGSAELLENGLVKEEDRSRFTGHIRKEAARLVSLIEDIIRLSQLDEGSELPMEPVDLYVLAEDAAEMLTVPAKEKNVTIQIHGESAEINGVPSLLREVIYNLCDNAVKYNVEGGRVDVTLTKDKESVLLTVADTGIGIPKEDQVRVFERFYRVDKAHSRNAGGTGLGLSIVKHAGKYHNAVISLESEINRGTTISVKFPVR